MTRAVPPAFADRWSRLGDDLRSRSLDALLVSHPPDIRYLCGFSGSSGLLLHPAEGVPLLITDFRYEEQAGLEVPGPVRIHIARDGLIAAVGEVLPDDDGPARIGFEPEHLSVLDRRRLDEGTEGEREWREAPGAVSRLRAVKDEGEVERIRRAIGLAQDALQRIMAVVSAEREALRERDVAARLEFELRQGGSDTLPFEPIVASGPRTSLPHARPGEGRLAERELLLIDFGASVDGYCCDITRTFVLGSARGWQRELHDLVREAQRVAIETVRAGIAAAEVDGAARRVLAARDRERLFGHSLGHGIGLEVHEEPRLSRKSDDVLVAGNVVTVEPGVYVPGRGGVRIEDDVHVTEHGPERLTDFSRDLIEL